MYKLKKKRKKQKYIKEKIKGGSFLPFKYQIYKYKNKKKQKGGFFGWKEIWS